MLRVSAWAARHDRAFASVEEPPQRRLAEWTDQGFRARRRVEFGARITAIATQVASEVSAAVASEVSAAVAAALQAARAGHHEYLDLAPTTTSTPTVSVADDNASVPDASMVVSAERSASASAQQQEDAAPRQAMENTVANVLAAWTPTTCSTRCPSRAVTVSVSALASAAASTLSEVTVGVVTECCCFDLAPAAATSTPTSALDVSGACSSAVNSLALPATSDCSAVVHTTCSTGCPSCVASEESALNSSAETPSSMTTVDVVPELATPVDNDEAIDVVTTVVAALDVFPINGSISITKEQADETGNPHLLKYSVLMNSGFKFCQVKLLFQDDYAHEAQSDSHVIDTGFTHNDNDFEPACKTLVRCFSSISDFAWVDRVSFPLPKSVVRLENHIEKLQKYFVFLVALKPWPSCELLLLIVIWASAESDADHNLVLLQRKIGEGAVNMQFSRPSHEVHVYWLLPCSPGYHRQNSWFFQYGSCNMLKCVHDTHHDPEYFLWAIAWSLVDSFCARSNFERSGIVTIREPSWNYQCCFGPIQWEIAWFFPLEYFASDRPIVQPLFANSVQPCTPGEVSLPELEQVQWRPARVTFKELLFPHMGEEILPANSIVVYYGVVAAPAWYMLGTEFISADAYFAELHKVQCTCAFWSCILRAQTAVSLLAYGNSTLKGPMEQWDPSIPKIFHICTRYYQVSCHIKSDAVTTELAHNKFLQAVFQLYTMNYALLHGHAHIQIANSVMDRISLSPLDYLLQSCDARHVCSGGSASISCEMFAIGNLSVVLLSEELQFSWDLGGPNFFGLFTQAGSKGRRNTAIPTYCCNQYLDQAYYFNQVHAGQDFYLDAYLDQDPVGYDYYISLTQVYSYDNYIISHGYHDDPTTIEQSQVPWDPAGLTGHRLEVKPNFKEGGMLATNPTLAWAGPCVAGLGLHGGLGREQLHIRWNSLHTTRLGTRRLRPPLLLSSSSSGVPSLPLLVELEESMAVISIDEE